LTKINENIYFLGHNVGREDRGRLEVGKRGSEGARRSEGEGKKDRTSGKRRRVDEGVVMAGMELASGW